MTTVAPRDSRTELVASTGIPAEITTNRVLDGSQPGNIGNKTKTGGCAQLEIGTSFRRSLFGTNSRRQRKNTTNGSFWQLVGALRRAISQVA